VAEAISSLMPAWLWMALLCAFVTGTSDALVKHLLVRSDERVVGWAKLLFSLPWLFLFPMVAGWPKVSPLFWEVVAIMVPLEIISYLFSLRSLRLAPLSLTMPFQAITPLLTIVTGFLIMGERVSLQGFMGILGVTVGIYVMQIELAAEGWFQPIKAMFTNRGIRLMLAAAAIYSITSTLSKRAVQLSSPLAFPFLYLGVDTLFLTPMAHQSARRSKGGLGLLPEVRTQLPLYLLSGLLTAGSFLTHCIAIQSAPVAYFISIKRLSLLVSVLYGGLVFREASFRQRVLGTVLMLLGALLITLTSS